MTSPRTLPGIGAVLVLVAACSSAPAPPAPSPTRPALRCASAVSRAALPEWARTGFSGDGSGVPHVVGAQGDLVAVLFQYPPTAAADPRVGDKILWVSRPTQQPMQPLTIHAVLDDGATVAEREVPEGPGPSQVNFPAAGCWTLTLSWSGHTDTMAIPVSEETDATAVPPSAG